MLRTALSAWNAALNVLIYPSTWLHEQTHYVVLRPYVTDATGDYHPTQSTASLSVDIEDIPRWRYFLGTIAPTLLGLLCAMCAALVSASGLASARGGLVGWLVAGTYWFLYTLPSLADLTAAADAAQNGGSKK
jgi:hypothetical protein